MTAESLPAQPQEDLAEFHADQAAPILAGHFVHDSYAAMAPALLPALIEKLSLSLTAAGSLTAVMQIPGVLNPLIGYVADKVSVRIFIVLAPALTTTAVSLVGLAPSYWTIAILLFAAGVSTALFHAPAPAMLARASGRRVGLGMSLFMATGELGYAVGPLLAVWALSVWTLEGMWRLMFLGWAVSAVLFFRLSHAAARPEKAGSLRAMLPGVWRLFIPIILINTFRNPLMEAITTYLPTYMHLRGASMWIAGASLSVVELSGVPGALLVGVLSDRLNRRWVLLGASLAASLLMLAFLQAEGWVKLALLIAIGFSAYSTQPVVQAIVQQQFPNNRAVANGLYMMTMFVLRPVGTFFVGALGDWLGLETAYMIAALVSLLTLPAILALPQDLPGE